MDVKSLEYLERLLQHWGMGPGVVLGMVLAGALVILLARGVYALATSGHRRRVEFLERYETLQAGIPDRLALETAIRHGFGLWLPAKAIDRIRALPSPGLCLLALSNVLSHLEVDETHGTFRVKPWLASRTRRRILLALLLLVYLVCSIVVTIALGMTTSLAVPLPLGARIVFGLGFLVIGVFSLDMASDLHRVPGFLARYPTLCPQAQSAVPHQDVGPVGGKRVDAPSRRSASEASTPRA